MSSSIKIEIEKENFKKFEESAKQYIEAAMKLAKKIAKMKPNPPSKASIVFNSLSTWYDILYYNFSELIDLAPRVAGYLENHPTPSVNVEPLKMSLRKFFQLSKELEDSQAMAGATSNKISDNPQEYANMPLETLAQYTQEGINLTLKLINSVAKIKENALTVQEQAKMFIDYTQPYSDYDYLRAEMMKLDESISILSQYIVGYAKSPEFQQLASTNALLEADIKLANQQLNNSKRG